MLQSQEIFLLTSVREIAYPIAAAAGGAIATLYRNGRKDTIDAIHVVIEEGAA